MNVVIIGGTGHVGTYLVPRLVMAGHQVMWSAKGRGMDSARLSSVDDLDI